MKKTIMFLLAGLYLFVSSDLWAEHREVQKDGQNVDGIVIYNGNIVSPDGGKNSLSHDFNTYFLINGKYGIGLDTTFCADNDYLSMKPYATFSVGNGLSLVGGFSTNSAGADYLNAGIWYFGTLGEKVKIFLSPRFYFESSDAANSYFDGFAELSYPVNDRLTLAINVIYDHWWNSGANWALVGPVAYWKINGSTSIFTRIARETDFEGGEKTDYRVGLKWTF